MTAMAAKEEKIDHAFYEELQSQLKEALNAKKVADKALSSVEDQIEKFEGIFCLFWYTQDCLSYSKLSDRNERQRKRG